MHADALTTALQKVMFSIPPEILDATFTPAARRTTLDMCIVNDVIRGMVLTDCNIRGGKVVDIVLSQENAVPVDAPVPYTLGPSGTWSIYRVPPSARENKDISAVIGIRFPYNLYAGTNQVSPCAGNYNGAVSVPQLACAVLNSHTFAEAVTTPTPILLEGNTIKLDPPQLSHLDWILRCRLAFDIDFTNMDVNTLPTFAKLVVAAVKWYIFKENIIKMGKTYLSGGQELGVFKEHVESYRDQEEKYDELLTEFLGASILDPSRLNKIIQWML